MPIVSDFCVSRESKISNFYRPESMIDTTRGKLLLSGAKQTWQERHWQESELDECSSSPNYSLESSDEKTAPEELIASMPSQLAELSQLMATQVESKDECALINSTKRLKLSLKQTATKLSNEFTFYEGQEDDEQMSIDS